MVAIGSSRPIRNAAPPAAAVYSRASTGCTLGTIRTDSKTTGDHLTFDETHTGLDCSCTSLAGKLVIRCCHVGCRTDCFTNRTCSRLHRHKGGIRCLHIQLRSPLDRSFSGEAHYALLRLQSLQRPHQDQEPISQKHPVPRKSLQRCTPDSRNLFHLDSVSRNIHSVGNYAYHSFSLSVLTILSISIIVHITVMRSRSAIFSTIRMNIPDIESLQHHASGFEGK